MSTVSRTMRTYLPVVIIGILVLSLLFTWIYFRLFTHPLILILIPIAVLYNAILVGTGVILRRPIACAIAWTIARTTAFVAFLVAGMVIPGDEGFSVFASQVVLDFPLYVIANKVGIDYWTICIGWYPAMGYLFGRWMQSLAAKR